MPIPSRFFNGRYQLAEGLAGMLWNKQALTTPELRKPSLMAISSSLLLTGQSCQLVNQVKQDVVKCLCSDHRLTAGHPWDP